MNTAPKPAAEPHTAPDHEGPTILRGAGEERLATEPLPPCTCDHEDGPCTCARAAAIKATHLRRG